ncbi:MAG: Smr/MutS family protein [Crocinitomicaceae bacterium]|nr:Smr/MutS family protein [Crocinitomicaceae bacterium]
MRFKINQKVVFLHEVGGGIVRSYNPNNQTYQIEDETGFERPFPENELAALIADQSNIDIENSALLNKNEQHKNNRSFVSSDFIQKKNLFWEVDLHTHKIMQSERGKTPAELLNYQLFILKKTVRAVRDQNVQKLVIIHGEGKGVLKQEVLNYLQGIDGIKEMYDANFHEYGKGATTVEFLQNSKHSF